MIFITYRKSLLRPAWLFLLISILSGFFFAASPVPAYAYPGFSRSYEFPCEFCHIQWPKLNDQGNFFKDRGFMLSTTGTANGLDLMFAQPSNQSYFPIGFHMSMAYEGSSITGIGSPSDKFTGSNSNTTTGKAFSTGGSGSSSNGGWGNGANSHTPWDLLSGGLLAPWISFWVQPGVNGPASDLTPVFGIQKLWVRFDDLFGTTLLNLYAGMTSQDTPFSSKRALQIGEATPYMMYDYVPGTPEVVSNSNNTGVMGYGSAVLSAYYDADSYQMKNDHTALRYFGYLFENGCGSDDAFSSSPCETRLSISLSPNSGLYGNSDGVGSATSSVLPGVPLNNNGFEAFIHLTQAFGGWGATNGERIGFFALVGEAATTAGGSIGTSPDALYSREGFDLSVNPVPDGVFNLFGSWELTSDPASMIVANPAVLGSNAGRTTGGARMMAWFLEADWQPTFSGFFAESGTNSNLLSITYNQVAMLQQPTFSGIANLPANFNNVLEFDLLDRYWLWGSDRTAVSLFAEWQWMMDFGVGSETSASGSILSGYGTAGALASTIQWGNVTANNFIVGLDFAY